MRRLLTWVALALALAAAATAQQAADTDDGSFLERKIEELLSDAGRQVIVSGFQGALSSNATLERMTIADGEGVWLTLVDAKLEWDRAALLRGRLEVQRLTASAVELPRLPVAEPGIDLPSPEARPFKLPDLPVSVEIGEFAVDEVTLGAPILGEKVTLSVDGAARLVEGEGQAELTVERIDGTGGALTFAGAFANASDALTLDLRLSEPADGVAVRLLDLPGRASVDLAVEGAGVLSDFVADIGLATGGQDRLSGAVRLLSQPGEGPRPTRRFEAALAGDLAPVFSPDFAPFFGDAIRLRALGSQDPDGRLTLDAFDLAARALDLSGRVILGPNWAPEAIDVKGRIADPGGEAVLLPAARDIRIDGAEIEIAFDAAEGEFWTADVVLDGLKTPAIEAARLALTGQGRIAAGPGGVEEVTADLAFRASGLDPADPGIAAALGPRIDGSATLNWTAGGALILDALDFSGARFGFDGRGRIDPSDRGPVAGFDGNLVAADLAAFAPLAGRPLGGAAKLSAAVGYGLTSRALTLRLAGRTDGLRLGQRQFDRLFAGTTDLALALSRDETGTLLEDLSLTNAAAQLNGQAHLSSTGGEAQLSLSLPDIGLIEPKVSGPAALDVAASGIPGDWRVSLDMQALGGSLTFQGGFDDLAASPVASGSLALTRLDLSRVGPLIDRPLAGVVEGEVTGSAPIDLSRFDVEARVTGADMAIGIAELDAALRGEAAVVLSANRKPGEGAITVDALSLLSETLTLSGTGRHDPGRGRFDLTAEVPDLAPFGAGLSGKAALTANGSEDQLGWAVVAVATALDARANFDGRVDDLADPAPLVSGRLHLDALNLARIRGLAGRSLSGTLYADLAGSLRTNRSEFDIAGNVSGQGLGTGIADVDRLLTGATNLGVKAAKPGENRPIAIQRLRLETRAFQLSAAGSYGAGQSALKLNGWLDDMGRFAPGFAGPVNASGGIGAAAGGVSLDISARGPGGLTAAVAGTAATDFRRVNLSIDGAAPLAFLNPMLKPQSLAGTARFDLALNGPPGLDALSGTATTEGARAVLPGPGVVLDGIAATVRLSGGTARVAATARKQAGGRIAARGTLGLTGAQPVDLNVELAGIVVEDLPLYRTTVDGALSLTGAIREGARAAGTLTLGPTEIRVPSSGLGTAGPIPDLIHLSEPAQVRATRVRAGLVGSAGGGEPGGGGGGAPAVALDIAVLAPNRIFVRGRGLDAELGGRLDLSGSTKHVVPAGSLELIRGRLDLLGKRLTLTEGSIALQGDFSPYLRLVAETEANGTDLFITLEGPLDSPAIGFSSQPELPEDEVLAQLLFGKSLTDISPLQAARLALAVRTLAGKGGEGVVGRLRSQFGLDDLDITTDDSGNAALRAGAYLSENLYSDVTVTATGETEVNLNLDLTPSVTVRGTVDNKGESSLGIFFEKDY